MPTTNKYTYEFSQSISGSIIKSTDTVEFSFKAMSDDSRAKFYASQHVNFFYSASSGDGSWTQFPNSEQLSLPSSFAIGTAYNRRSFILSPPTDIVGAKAIISGAVGLGYGSTTETDNTLGTRPSFNIDYDDFNFKVEKAKVELTDEGFLVYSTPSRYIRATRDGVEIKGGSVEADRITTNDLEVYGNVAIFGDVQASAIPPNSKDDIIQQVGRTPDSGELIDYARADHRHNLEFGVLNQVAGEGTFTHISSSDIDVIDTLTAGTIITTVISSSVAQVTGSTQFGSSSLDTHQLTGSLFISGSTTINRDLIVSGTAAIIGATTLDGNLSVKGGKIILGDSNSDNISLKGDISSSIIPDSNNFDLGSSGTTWRQVYTAGVKTTNITASVGNFSSNITASGDISASGTIYAKTFQSGDGQGGDDIDFTDGIDVTGNITASGNISSSLTGSFGQIRLQDNEQILLGTGRDLQIYHNGAHSYIHEAGEGDLKILGGNLKLQDKDGENFLVATEDAGVKVYYDNTEKFETTSEGINVTGNITASGDISASGTITAEHLRSDDDLSIAGKGSIQEKLAIGTTTHADNMELTVAGDISASGDLDITAVTTSIAGVYLGEGKLYSDDGSTTYLYGGTHLELDATNTITLDAGGDIELNADGGDINFKDASTTLGGINNSGIFSNNNITASGDISASGTIYANAIDNVNTTHITASGNISSSGKLFGTQLGLNVDDPSVELHVLSNDGNRPTIGISHAAGTAYVDTDYRLSIYDGNAGQVTNGIGMRNGGASAGSGIRLTQEVRNQISSSMVTILEPDLSSSATYFATTTASVYSEKVRITGGGNVGIGTTTPSKKLEVAGDISASGTVFADRFESRTGGTAIDFNDSIDLEGHLTASGDISSSATSTGSFGHGYFDGNVGINTTTPVYKLEVKNTSANAELGITGANNDARLVLTSNESSWLVQNDYSNAGALSFYNGTGGHTLVIAEAGNVGIGTTSPSQKLTIAGNISASNQSSDMNMDLNVGSTDTNHDTRLRFLVSGSVKGMVGFDRGNDTINLTYGGKDVYHLNIDKSGNVGFGTANTSFTAGTNSSGIEIQKTGSTVLRLDNSADNTNLELRADGSNLDLQWSNHDFIFKPNYSNTNAITFGNTGNVGLGMTSEPAVKLDVRGAQYIRDSLGTGSFFSGFAGSGWKISNSPTDSHGSSGSVGWGMSLDNLTVRGTMKVYELLIQQLRATNGSVWVSSTGKLDNASYLGDSSWSLQFDTGSNTYGHGFLEGDLIRAQKFQGAGSQDVVTRSDLIVLNVGDSGSLTAVSASTGTTPPEGGFDFVRIGNVSDANRQGSVYLTSDDDSAPYIDVIDGVSSHTSFNSSNNVKARLGKLDGISDPVYGDLGATANNYGLYSDNVYLKGGIRATFGEIGGWSIDATTLSSSEGNFILDSASGSNASASLRLGGSAAGMDIDTNTGIFMNAHGHFRAGNPTTEYIRWDGTDLKIKTNNLDITASDIDMTTDNFELDASGIEISSTQQSMSLGSSNQLNLDGNGGSGGAPIIKLDGGEISASNFFVSTQGEMTASAGLVAGWIIAPNTLSGGTLRLNSSGDGYFEVGGLSGVDEEGTTKIGSFFGGDGKVLMKAGNTANSNYIKLKNNELKLHSTNVDISGSNVNVQTPSFFFGSATNNISSSNDDLSITTKNLTASGSNVEILTPSFFLGDVNSSISSSATGLSINTNEFELDSDGLSLSSQQASMSLGGGKIILSGSSVPVIKIDGGEISASDFFVSAQGQMTASAGAIGGWNITDTLIYSDTNEIYLQSDNGGKLWMGAGTYDTGKIGLKGDGSGWVSNKSMSWDTSGNLQLTASKVDISGSDVNILTPSFFFGNETSYISSSNNGLRLQSNDVKISGSSVEVETPSFFLGSSQKFLSGSGTSIEISSSGFHLKPEGDAVFSGSITANDGLIGGFTIGSNKLSTTGFEIGDSTQTYAISSSDFQVKHSGQITASAGQLGGWIISNTKLSKDRLSINSLDNTIIITDTNTEEVVLVGDKAMSGISGSNVNYIGNHSFEVYNSQGWDGWEVASGSSNEAWDGGTATFVSSTTNAYTGSKSFRISVLAETGGGGS